MIAACGTTSTRSTNKDGPVVSAHRSTAAGTTFYVVTTADRSETTVFLPAEGSL